MAPGDGVGIGHRNHRDVYQKTSARLQMSPAPPSSRIKRFHLTHKEKNVFKSEESTEK